MSLEKTQNRQTRRTFLRQGIYGAAAAVGLGTTAFVAVRRWSQGRQTDAALAEKNPFSYNVEHLTKTDPELLHYREVGRFSSPRSDARHLGCAPDGRLYLAAGNYVSVLDSEGRAMTEIAVSSAARCVAVGGDGLIYIGLRDHIEVFDARGRRQAAWDPAAKRTWFTGLAAGDSELFAADAGNRVILRYDKSGKLLSRIGEKKEGRQGSGFSVPSPFFDVALGSDGLLRVTNPGRHRIEIYTREGELESSWGRASAAIDGFCGCCNPVNLALLDDGRCVTCEKGLPRVKVYGSDGQLESVVAGPESFAGKTRETDEAHGLDVAIGPGGKIFILDMALAEVRVMELAVPGGTGNLPVPDSASVFGFNRG